MRADLDLLVVGAGPAGRALSFRAVGAGLRVRLIDPDPTRPWRATYGAWTDELPRWISAECIAASSSSAVVYTPRRRVLARGYTVLNSAALQHALSDGVTAVSARATGVGSHEVTLEDGERLTATTVVDARGNLGGMTAGAPRQTAVGVRRPADTPEMVVMDWRRPSAATPPAATFSYRVALGPAMELVEETCLAGTPPVGLELLAQRSAARLGGDAPDVSGADPDVELVDFALRPAGRPPWRSAADDGPLRFGAAGGLMHPATGYSVAATLSAADIVVAALQGGRDPRTALWPPSARAVYELRAAGLTAVLRMDVDELTAFFDAFFSLPPESQYAYLSSRSDVAGMLRAMWQVFARLDARGRPRLVAGFVAGLSRNAFTRMTDSRR